MKREQHHTSVISIVEYFLRQAKIDPPEYWAAVDGQPTRPKLAQELTDLFHPAVRLTDFHVDGLSSDTDAATIDTPMLEQSTHGIRGPLPTANDATDKLRAKGVSISEVADTLGVHYSAARSWFQKGPNGRRVPHRYMSALKKKFGLLPADMPNGVGPEK